LSSRLNLLLVVECKRNINAMWKKMPHVLAPGLIQRGGATSRNAPGYGKAAIFTVDRKNSLFYGLTAKIRRQAFFAGLGRDPP
jgi:hypothetical protein